MTFEMRRAPMNRVRYVHWQEEDFHLGYFEDFPDYITQGKTLDELLENLRDMFKDISSGEIPSRSRARRTGRVSGISAEYRSEP